MVTEQAAIRGALQSALSLLSHPHGQLFVLLVFVLKEDEGENPLCEMQGPE